MTIINGEDYLTGNEAAAYLAEKWGMETYSPVAFRMLRKRWGIKPDISFHATSLWKKATLDAIPKPDRTRPRPRKTEPGLKAIDKDAA